MKDWNCFPLKSVPFGESDFFREAGDVYFPVKKNFFIKYVHSFLARIGIFKKERDHECFILLNYVWGTDNLAFSFYPISYFCKT